MFFESSPVFSSDGELPKSHWNIRTSNFFYSLLLSRCSIYDVLLARQIWSLTPVIPRMNVRNAHIYTVLIIYLNHTMTLQSSPMLYNKICMYKNCYLGCSWCHWKFVAKVQCQRIFLQSRFVSHVCRCTGGTARPRQILWHVCCISRHERMQIVEGWNCCYPSITLCSFMFV